MCKRDSSSPRSSLFPVISPREIDLSIEGFSDNSVPQEQAFFSEMKSVKRLAVGELESCWLLQWYTHCKLKGNFMKFIVTVELFYLWLHWSLSWLSETVGQIKTIFCRFAFSLKWFSSSYDDFVEEDHYPQVLAFSRQWCYPWATKTLPSFSAF